MSKVRRQDCQYTQRGQPTGRHQREPPIGFVAYVGIGSRRDQSVGWVDGETKLLTNKGEACGYLLVNTNLKNVARRCSHDRYKQ